MLSPLLCTTKLSCLKLYDFKKNEVILSLSKIAQSSQHFYCWIRKQAFPCCHTNLFLLSFAGVSSIFLSFVHFSTGQFNSLFVIFKQLVFFCILFLTLISLASPSSRHPHRSWPYQAGVIQAEFCRCSTKKGDTAVTSTQVNTCIIPPYVSAQNRT